MLAKASAPLSYVQVKFPDINTETQVPSPVCLLSAAGLSNNCSPYLVKFSNPDDPNYPNYQNTKIDTTWRRFDVMFADAKDIKAHFVSHIPQVIQLALEPK
jgi:hypothetical protein